MPVGTATNQIGELLRSWRQQRNLSQLELALGAEVSSRHVSFVETGRAQPSREMVLRLAGELAIPMREQNTLLLAAGYAPLHPERSLDAPDMAPVRQALDRFLRAHEPYPALVVDRQHDLIAGNDALDLLLDGVSPDLLQAPANAMRIALHPEGMAPRTRNLAAWSAHLLHRLRREAQITGDPQLAELYRELIGYPGVTTALSHTTIQPADIVLPLKLLDLDGTGELSFFSTISTFGTPADITLSELAIEAFYPANAQTAMQLMDAVAADPPDRSSPGLAT